MTLAVNLFAGPGAGKSTLAAGVFALLKLHGVNAELVTEYAKDATWEGRERTLANQTYVFGKQFHRMWRVADQVDVIVTDSPLLLSLVYSDPDDEWFRGLVVSRHRQFDNLNFYVCRQQPYVAVGRSQSEEQARVLDWLIGERLDGIGEPYLVVAGNAAGINGVAEQVLDRLAVPMRCGVLDWSD